MFQSPTLGNLVDSKKSKTKTRLDLPTIRFNVKLEKPSAEQFNEFNYNKLLVKALKHSKHQLRLEEKSGGRENEGTDDNGAEKSTKMVIKSDDEFSLLDGSFEIERDEVRSLLRTYRDKLVLGKHMADMEDENGPQAEDDDENSGGENMDDDDMDVDEKPGAKKSKKKFDSATADIIGSIRLKYTDLGHLGKGYDGNDSFIDDSDAIDVQVPKNMATKHGGFYMNKAKVQLERIDEKKKQKKKKRARVQEEDEDDDKNVSGKAQSNDVSKNGENPDDEDEEDGDYDGEEEDGEEEDDSDDSEDSDDFTDSDSDVYETTSTEDEVEQDQESNGKEDTAVVKQTAKRKKIESDDENSSEQKQNGGGISSKEISIKDKENKLASMSISKKTRKDEPGDQKPVTNEAVKINKPATSSPMPNQGLFNNQNMNKSTQIKKPTRPNEISTGMVGTSQNPIKINSDVITDEQKLKSSLPRTFEQHGTTSGHGGHHLSLPNGISESLRSNIENFLVTFNTSGNLSNPQKVWTSAMKAELFKIYTESHRLPNHKDHVQIFNYMSEKMNRSRDNLIRLCRKMTNKSTSPVQALIGPAQASSSAPVQTPTHSQAASRPPAVTTPVKQAQHNLTQQSPLSSIQLNLNDVSQDIRDKLSSLKSEFLTFKQKPENQQVGSNERLVHRFFEMTQIQEQVHKMDNSIRLGNGSKTAKPPRVREFCQSYLANIFQVSREMLISRYNYSFNQIRRRNFETALVSKMAELKNEIDANMPKNLDKYNKSMEEYNRSKIDPAVVSGEKKLTVPRKRFELTDKIKELISIIIRYKLNLYISSTGPLASPQTPSKPLDPTTLDQQDKDKRIEYIKQFFDEELINLWPSNWMQKNVLMSLYEKQLMAQAKKTINPANQSLNQATPSLPISQQQPKSTSSTPVQQPTKPAISQQPQPQQQFRPSILTTPIQQQSKSANTTPIQQSNKPTINSAQQPPVNNNIASREMKMPSVHGSTPTSNGSMANFSQKPSSATTSQKSNQMTSNGPMVNKKPHQPQQAGGMNSSMHHSNSNGSMQVINASAKSGKPVSIEYQPITSNTPQQSMKSTQFDSNNRSSQIQQSPEKSVPRLQQAFHSNSPTPSFQQQQLLLTEEIQAQVRAALQLAPNFTPQMNSNDLLPCTKNNMSPIYNQQQQSQLLLNKLASMTQQQFHHHRNPDHNDSESDPYRFN